MSAQARARAIALTGALAACHAEGATQPATEPRAAGITLGGPGTYTLRSAGGGTLGSLTLGAPVQGALVEAQPPALPSTLSVLSPALEVRTPGPALSSPGTLSLSVTDPQCDRAAVWALAVGSGGARRMPIVRWTETEGGLAAELPAVDAGRYVLVTPRVTPGCSGAPSADASDALAELRGVSHASGSLALTPALIAAGGLAALDCLVMLDGDLRIAGTDDAAPLAELSALRNLTLVGGNVVLSHPVLHAELPALLVADGSVALDHAQAVSLPALQHIAGGLGIGAGVRSLAAPVLRVIAGSLGVVRSELTGLDGLAALSAVGAHVAVVANARLASIDGLDALRLVGGELVIAQNPALPAGAGPALDSLGEVVPAKGVRPLGPEDAPWLGAQPSP